jgi:hypothetical protein
MAKVKLDIGAHVDFLNKGELSDALEADRQKVAAYDRDTYRGIKYFRLPFLIGTIASNAVKLGTQAGNQHSTPDAGYVWMVKRLFVSGLKADPTTPDVLAIYRGGLDHPMNQVWQLTGNSPGATFGKMELVFLAGEYLQAVNVGNLGATGQVILTGEAISVPQEMIGKLT